MRKNIVTQFLISIRFYFWAIVFFREIAWLRMRGKYVKASEIIPSAPDEQWLEEGEVKITPKPPKGEAMANKAKLGMSQIPEKYRKHFVWGITISIFFFLFGVGNFIYWASVIIKAYPIIGKTLLYGLLTYILYRIGKYEYYYFKEKKYDTFLSVIKITWEEAKEKSQLKFQI